MSSHKLMGEGSLAKHDQLSFRLTTLLRTQEGLSMLDAKGPSGVKVARRDSRSPVGYRIDDVAAREELYNLTNLPLPEMVATHTEEDLAALDIVPGERRVAEALRVAKIGTAKTPHPCHGVVSRRDSMLLQESSALGFTLKAAFSAGVPSLIPTRALGSCSDDAVDHAR